MPLPRCAVAIAVAALAWPASMQAQQPVWQPIPNPGDAPPSLARTTYDSWRQRSVAVDATWLAEFDRARWRRGSPGSGTGFDHSAVAFDRARGVTVAFGGSFPFFADAGTREWNGATWTLRTLPTSPPGRSRAAMAFDRLRAQQLLFAGSMRGGRAAAVLYTLIESCKLVGVDVPCYLSDVLIRIATHPASRIDALLPANRDKHFAATASASVKAPSTGAGSSSGRQGRRTLTIGTAVRRVARAAVP
jgi:hypothetical protein